MVTSQGQDPGSHLQSGLARPLTSSENLDNWLNTLDQQNGDKRQHPQQKAAVSSKRGSISLRMKLSDRNNHSRSGPTRAGLFCFGTKQQTPSDIFSSLLCFRTYTEEK